MISLEKQKVLEERMRKLGILEQDLEESFVRSQGAGGQKVNKSSSCVRLVHRPTGIEVKCQISRHQTENRFLALRILCDKYETQILKVQSEKDREIYRIRKQKKRRSRRSKEKMLADKKAHAQKKQLRKVIKYP
ncbi:MAG: hypothetical protein A2Z91_09515 [Deltaproteobacteria bacterium GWA2_38_16]|nr:MAG: hypothetical protein A2Z91_09515 [Deltaproteobacteria bacterium GWA2_38_16]OGQ02469.1 MAG: hypothetical protein A3D19_09215 [Deltaproteobacteria bacterium RIFCSPHIGHO2_02_FULL_38_15]OGQ62184.1 MAG: hypothetical protein A3G92_07735 [Deltaproteobacteria bacterium RIFCSPLOWO2_12_FULL_38_8]